MAVIAHVVLRGVSKQEYDQVRAATGWLKQAPVGGLAHLTWWEGNDCHNMDAWENEQTFGTFAETRLAPAMAKVGVTAKPEVTFHPAHEVFLPRALTTTASPA
jgi:hypothetical protein